jgi:transcriptional regulator with XRE-family HTH domain
LISPYVRRLRLGRELTQLRKRAGLTHAKLAARTGLSQSKISRLESGPYRPDQGDVIRVLDGLDVPENGERHRILTIAQEAAGRGWWESIPMDARQALYAALEAGAVAIREYQDTVIPGLLQTPQYTKAIAANDDLSFGADTSAPDVATRARAERQRMLRLNGATYEVIVDEVVIRRLSVPPNVHIAELRHLAANSGRASVRILPVDARIDAYTVPRSPFSLYSFGDPKDPRVAAVDTVTSDLILVDEGEVERYEHLYCRLRKAALSPQDSAYLLAKAADEMEVSGHGV